MNSEIVLLTYVASGLAEVEISAWLLGEVIKYKLGHDFVGLGHRF